MLALPCVRSVSRSNACFGFQSSGLFHEVPFELVEVVRERSLGTRLDCGGPGCTWGTLQCSSNMSFGCAAACPSWAASVDGLGFRFPSVDLSCPCRASCTVLLPISKELWGFQPTAKWHWACCGGWDLLWIIFFSFYINHWGWMTRLRVR